MKSATAALSEKPVLKRVDKYRNRKALVIGNAYYTDQTPLKNPINDAKAVSSKLKEVGFDVTYKENLGVRDFGRALSEFERSLKGSDISLLYYAGHGIEIDKQNYLIPVDADIRSTSDVRYEAVSLDDAVDVALNTSKLSMVLIDACRDNPFANQMTDRTRSVGRGLSVVEVNSGPVYQILSFAAASGQVAEDGDGNNSPYASVLVDLLDEPNLEVGKMFRLLGQRVEDMTGGKQQPIKRDNLRGEDIFLVETR
ncbi:MAG: caspase family protein [Oceanospirillaceae bacterium]|nr:caspase family protein [Oceanospirillaceae bacterium]